MQHSLARLTAEMASYPAGAEDIITAEAASRAVQALESSSELAVDLEQDAMHAFRPRLCFIQVATDKDLFLFDTLSPEVDPKLLAPLLGDPGRTKFFHAAVGDLQYLAQGGVRVRGLFDTHRAATLLGWPKVGLADLARERLGVELPKEHQQSDFSIRPLPEAMRQYIADDVRYLCEIGRQVREECRKADILEEVELDCQRLSDDAASPPEIGSDYRPKLPRNLPAAPQALARAIADGLHQRRLAWAEELDIPHGRVLSNAAIAELAKKPPKTMKELANTARVRGRFAREHGAEILALIEQLTEAANRGELAADGAPTEAPDRAQRRREEALRAFRSEKAVQRKVTPSVVLSNGLLQDLAKSAPRTLEELARVPYLGEKRVRLYGIELIQLLSKYR
jgi:ribonuclease D